MFPHPSPSHLFLRGDPRGGIKLARSLSSPPPFALKPCKMPQWREGKKGFFFVPARLGRKKRNSMGSFPPLPPPSVRYSANQAERSRAGGGPGGKEEERFSVGSLPFLLPPLRLWDSSECSKDLLPSLSPPSALNPREENPAEIQTAHILFPPPSYSPGFGALEGRVHGQNFKMISVPIHSVPLSSTPPADGEASLGAGGRGE